MQRRPNRASAFALALLLSSARPSAAQPYLPLSADETAEIEQIVASMPIRDAAAQLIAVGVPSDVINYHSHPVFEALVALKPGFLFLNAYNYRNDRLGSYEQSVAAIRAFHFALRQAYRERDLPPPILLVDFEHEPFSSFRGTPIPHPPPSITLAATRDGELTDASRCTRYKRHVPNPNWRVTCLPDLQPPKGDSWDRAKARVAEAGAEGENADFVVMTVFDPIHDVQLAGILAESLDGRGSSAPGLVLLLHVTPRVLAPALFASATVVGNFSGAASAIDSDIEFLAGTLQPKGREFLPASLGHEGDVFDLPNEGMVFTARGEVSVVPRYSPAVQKLYEKIRELDGVVGDLRERIDFFTRREEAVREWLRYLVSLVGILLTAAGGVGMIGTYVRNVSSDAPPGGLKQMVWQITVAPFRKSWGSGLVSIAFLLVAIAGWQLWRPGNVAGIIERIEAELERPTAIAGPADVAAAPMEAPDPD